MARSRRPSLGQSRHRAEGKAIRAGDRMLLILAAANHDPAKYTDPDHLDITRSPNPHVALGRDSRLPWGPVSTTRGPGGLSGATTTLSRLAPGYRFSPPGVPPDHRGAGLKSLPVAW
jgi:hypothetical protein